MNDPRVEAAAKAFRPVMGNNPYGDAMVHALVAADAADREQGIHRVRVDEATVDRVARVIYLQEHGQWISGHGLYIGGMPWGTSKEKFLRPTYIERARAVLAALTGGEA